MLEVEQSAVPLHGFSAGEKGSLACPSVAERNELLAFHQRNRLCESGHEEAGRDARAPSPAIRTLLTYLTYVGIHIGEPLSPRTDPAWESVFPPHGGFFHHPILAPNGGSLAVYHQLHCPVSVPSSYI
jgi:hypothetical protein